MTNSKSNNSEIAFSQFSSFENNISIEKILDHESQCTPSISNMETCRNHLGKFLPIIYIIDLVIAESEITEQTNSIRIIGNNGLNTSTEMNTNNGLEIVNNMNYSAKLTEELAKIKSLYEQQVLQVKERNSELIRQTESREELNILRQLNGKIDDFRDNLNKLNNRINYLESKSNTGTSKGSDKPSQKILMENLHKGFPAYHSICTDVISDITS